LKPLLTERLIIRNWEDRDRDLFHVINSDEQVMAFYPFRRTRAESEEWFEKWRHEIMATGIGGFALELRASGECIGYCGLKYPHVEPFLSAETVEIGWRLAPQFWGKGYVTEAAEKSLEYGFKTVGLPEIVSFAAALNNRSTAVMQRLGMRRDEISDFDHPRVPDTHPQLKRHVVYRISADEWRLKAGI
jgi:RimJ/RimL family protein N-acetyltransferase